MVFVVSGIHDKENPSVASGLYLWLFIIINSIQSKFLMVTKRNSTIIELRYNGLSVT